MAGRTAVISGSSKGIGAGIALELSNRGANIVLNYPNPSTEAECHAVGCQLVTPWIAVCADLTSDDGPAELIRRAVERFGHIDILVSNAGYVPIAPTWDSTFLADFEAAARLNVRGCLALVQAALPHLTPYTPGSEPSGAVGGSRIVLVGSAASRNPKANQGAYAATKGALDAILRVWALELPPRYGCTVNLVAPGPVRTDTFLDRFNDEQWEHVSGLLSQETPVEGYAAAVEDVAWAVAFLAEERSRFINGLYMVVSGGSTMT
ncbi:3-oxoacyl-(Acyl-carrier protein) reductase [Pleurostoma richardsiae]|uniref:3-oxoacyl-(Acyl-carrier protein) reductase n=1 Tax=Pleurostoma richardsiae TaxID=41990 RepID=A0AA38VIK3_9PEZI|nr:3-oxoacyl-(Acyl-carrier protein) reductase [Pleurostoma richardsiae]